MARQRRLQELTPTACDGERKKREGERERRERKEEREEREEKREREQEEGSLCRSGLDVAALGWPAYQKLASGSPQGKLRWREGTQERESTEKEIMGSEKGETVAVVARWSSMAYRQQSITGEKVRSRG